LRGGAVSGPDKRVTVSPLCSEEFIGIAVAT
jgi:hypothetical protein